MQKTISFLETKKNITDKFFDVIKQYVKPVYFNVEEMELMGVDPTKAHFKHYKGIAEVSRLLKTSPNTIKRAIKKGVYKHNKKLKRKIGKSFKILKNEKKTSGEALTDFKKTTKEFTPHNFTRENFFEKPKKALNKYQQYYFRAGLYIVFERVKKVSTGDTPNPKEKNNMDFIIQNLPISSYSDNFSKGYEKIFEDIKFQITNHPSMLFFRFNYFDYSEIDVRTLTQPHSTGYIKEIYNLLKNEANK